MKRLVFSVFSVALVSFGSAAQTLIDPTQPPRMSGVSIADSADQVGRDGIKVNAVVFSGSVPYAILNGQIVDQGGLWQGYKLIEVLKDRVVLKEARREEGRQIEIPVYTNNEIKKDLSNDF